MALIAEVIVMTGARITAIVMGAVAMSAGLLTLIMGSPPTDYRDADGYYIDDPVMFDRPSRAIVTEDIEILRGVYTELAADSFVLYVTADPVELRIQGAAPEAASLFLGVAATSAVDDYLAGVAHHEVTQLERHDESKQILDIQYTAHQGTGAPNPPGTETFWEASVEGAGQQTLDWTLQTGNWTAVIMNADAASGVTADLAFGAAPASDIDSIGQTASTVAVIALIAGALLLVFGLLRRE